MNIIDRDLEEMERILAEIHTNCVEPMQSSALCLKKLGQLSATSLSGTKFASQNEEKVMVAADEILRILGYYDEYLVKELKKVRSQIETMKQLEDRGRSR
jgi:hypothetical protein